MARLSPRRLGHRPPTRDEVDDCRRSVSGSRAPPTDGSPRGLRSNAILFPPADPMTTGRTVATSCARADPPRDRNVPPHNLKDRHVDLRVGHWWSGGNGLMVDLGVGGGVGESCYVWLGNGGGGGGGRGRLWGDVVEGVGVVFPPSRPLCCARMNYPADTACAMDGSCTAMRTPVQIASFAFPAGQGESANEIIGLLRHLAMRRRCPSSEEDPP